MTLHCSSFRALIHHICAADPFRLRPLRAATIFVSPLLRGSPVKAGALPAAVVSASTDVLLASMAVGGLSIDGLVRTCFVARTGGCKELTFGDNAELEWSSGSTTLTSLEPSPPLAEMGFSGFAEARLALEGALEGARGKRFTERRSTPAGAAVGLRFPTCFDFAGELAGGCDTTTDGPVEKQ